MYTIHILYILYTIHMYILELFFSDKLNFGLAILLLSLYFLSLNFDPCADNFINSYILMVKLNFLFKLNYGDVFNPFPSAA